MPTQIAKGEPGKVSRSPLECGSHHTCLVETAYKSVSSEHDLSRGRGREPRAGLWAAHVDGTRAESCVHALAKVHASVHLPPLRSVARVYNFAPGPARRVRTVASASSSVVLVRTRRGPAASVVSGAFNNTRHTVHTAQVPHIRPSADIVNVSFE